MVLEWPQFHWVNFNGNLTKPAFMPAKPFKIFLKAHMEEETS
jgi:hypothetical protein